MKTLVLIDSSWWRGWGHFPRGMGGASSHLVRPVLRRLCAYEACSASEATSSFPISDLGADGAGSSSLLIWMLHASASWFEWCSREHHSNHDADVTQTRTRAQNIHTNNKHTHILTHTHTHTNVHMHAHAHTYSGQMLSLWACAQINTHVYMYMCMCIYIYAYIYIYIYTTSRTM
jgi:hypothetical protein